MDGRDPSSLKYCALDTKRGFGEERSTSSRLIDANNCPSSGYLRCNINVNIVCQCIHGHFIIYSIGGLQNQLIRRLR